MLRNASRHSSNTSTSTTSSNVSATDFMPSTDATSRVALRSRRLVGVTPASLPAGSEAFIFERAIFEQAIDVLSFNLSASMPTVPVLTGWDAGGAISSTMFNHGDEGVAMDAGERVGLVANVSIQLPNDARGSEVRAWLIWLDSPAAAHNLSARFEQLAAAANMTPAWEVAELSSPLVQSRLVEPEVEPPWTVPAWLVLTIVSSVLVGSGVVVLGCRCMVRTRRQTKVRKLERQQRDERLRAIFDDEAGRNLSPEGSPRRSWMSPGEDGDSDPASEDEPSEDAEAEVATGRRRPRRRNWPLTSTRERVLPNWDGAEGQAPEAAVSACVSGEPSPQPPRPPPPTPAAVSKDGPDGVDDRFKEGKSKE